MGWICINQINNEDDEILFIKQETYGEGDDRGDCEEGEIAICLINEQGGRSYLFNGQVTNNFTEIK